jgi:hypothetical protein
LFVAARALENPLPVPFATGRIRAIGRAARALAAKILQEGATTEIGVLLARKFFVARGKV